MRVVVVQKDKTVKIEEHPAPKPQANEILLKVISVGLNPTDYKHVDTLSKPGDWLGCDFVGEVIELGSAVPKEQVKKGEIRYITTDWDISSIVPSNITPQQAAGLPIPLLTGVQAFYLPSRLGLPEPPVSQPSKERILIWSGGTSVGSYAIQLAKLSGLKVAATASPKRWVLLRSYGAELMVDYKDPEVVSKLKALRRVTRTGKHSLPSVPRELEDLPRPEVKTIPTILYTLLGDDHTWGPFESKTDPSHRQLHVRWDKKITQLLAEGKLKPIPVQVLGGLEDI